MRQEDAITQWRRRAETAQRNGDTETAIRYLRQAAALFAAQGADELSDDRFRAEVNRQLAELLAGMGRLPEAMQAYQEAADAYGRVPGAEADAQACARRIVEGVRALRKKPKERLYLLIARYEREQRRLAAIPGTEREQAECVFHMATILQRRDRFADAVKRYEEALRFYEQAAGTGLQQAACHHRLADLFRYELPDYSRAGHHYRAAIRLYAAFEPLSEGEQMNRILCEWLLRELQTKTPGSSP
jgi:tetratricopeptide (TPR) repeat protein